MTELQSIAYRLVELVRDRKFLEAQGELFSSDAVTQEPEKFMQRSVSGLEAIMQKERLFLESIKEWKRFEVSTPVVSAHHFSIRMLTKVELLTGQKIELDEIIVYEVNQGKIVKEQFFYEL